MDSLEESHYFYHDGPHFTSSIQEDESEREKFASSSGYEAMIRKEVQHYRLRYFCFPSCSKFCKYAKMRCLHGTGVYLALFLLFLERFAFISVTGNIIDPFLKYFDQIPAVYRSLIQTALFQTVSQVMFPVFGLLGDRYIGRFRTTHISLWLLLLGYSLLSFVASFEPSYDIHHESDDGTQVNRYLLPICFIAITMGSAGFQANMIPFGADQIIGRPSDEISAYFFWYYCLRNLGSVIAGASLVCLFDYSSSVFGGVSAVSISLALIVIQCTQDKFHIDKARHNPLKLVVRVVRFVATVKRPLWRSAFSYTGVEAPSRIDLAKEIHGGWFTNVEVEDVKTFLRLLVFLASLVGVLIVYAGVVNVVGMQAKHMNGSFVSPQLRKNCSFSESSVWILNVGIIITFIPFFNFCVYPFLREYTPNMQKRIGVGHVLSVLSPLVLLVLSSVGFAMLRQDTASINLCMFKKYPKHEGHYLPISSYYVLLPHILVSLAEVLLIVSSLEFFYAQSPHTMRGMMVGLFFFTWGISTIVANLLVVFFTNVTVSVLTCGIWYYLLLVLLAVLALVVFLIVSRWYRNRERGDIEPDRYYRH